MKKWDWKRNDQNEKYGKHDWCTISLKTFTLVLQLKQSRKLYNLGSSKLLQFHFGTTIYFCYFLVPGWERREREKGCQIPMVEGETYSWHQFRPPKWGMLVSNYSIPIFRVFYRCCESKTGCKTSSLVKKT
jgi:hypothetical protein